MTKVWSSPDTRREIVPDISFNAGISTKSVLSLSSPFTLLRSFVQADKYRFHEDYPYLLPKSGDEDAKDVSTLQSIVGDERKLIEVDAQCLRSGSFWSCGTRTVEHSIQNAYLHLIENAEHFIYIEVKRDQRSSFVFDLERNVLESILREHCERLDDQESDR